MRKANSSVDDVVFCDHPLSIYCASQHVWLLCLPLRRSNSLEFDEHAQTMQLLGTTSFDVTRKVLVWSAVSFRIVMFRNRAV